MHAAQRSTFTCHKLNPQLPRALLKRKQQLPRIKPPLILHPQRPAADIINPQPRKPPRNITGRHELNARTQLALQLCVALQYRFSVLRREEQVSPLPTLNGVTNEAAITGGLDETGAEQRHLDVFLVAELLPYAADAEGGAGARVGGVSLHYGDVNWWQGG